jgi:predicted NBD/HSP70 family sugar kinase/biotin operon repressor
MRDRRITEEAHKGDRLRSTARPPGQPAHAGSLRRHNLALVLAEIARGEGVSRAQIAAASGLTRGTVSALVDTLASSGLIVEGGPNRGSVGRPGNALRLNADGPCGLGIEINVDYVAAALLDFTGRARSVRIVAGDNRGVDAQTVLGRSVNVAQRMLSESPGAQSNIVGVGVAVPGLVGSNGVLHRVPNLPGWESVPVAEIVQSSLGMPIEITLVDNEANLAALAEHWYSEDDVGNDFVRVSGEIGVGAGIVAGGELWRGVNGLSGELGHVTVEPNGPVCNCGARGCLEQIAGQEALLREAGAAMPAGTALGVPDGPIADLVARATAGDEQTLRALERAGRALGTALSTLVNVLDIPTIVLGGLYAEVAPWISADVNAELTTRAVGYQKTGVKLLVSQLGAEAAVRGAAGLVIRRIIDDPSLVADRLPR